MLNISIPGRKSLYLECLVLDFNGTIAEDGKLISGVKEKLKLLSNHLKIYVLTADTHGNVKKELQGLPLKVHIISPQDQAKAKLSFIQTLRPKRCVCIGNGENDALMLKEAGLGIGILQKEGMSISSLFASDVIITDINNALELLLYPLRIVATLRS